MKGSLPSMGAIIGLGAAVGVLLMPLLGPIAIAFGVAVGSSSGRRSKPGARRVGRADGCSISSHDARRGVIPHRSRRPGKGNRRAWSVATYTIPIEGRDEWLAAARRLA